MPNKKRPIYAWNIDGSLHERFGSVKECVEKMGVKNPLKAIETSSVALGKYVFSREDVFPGVKEARTRGRQKMPKKPAREKKDNRIPVWLFDAEGNPAGEFPSVADANRFLGRAAGRPIHYGLIAGKWYMNHRPTIDVSQRR